MASPATVTLAIVLLTIFLIFGAALRYGVANTFQRTRLVMTAFFCFIVVTLTISFSSYALQSLPYAIPAVLVGALVGHFVAVREAERKLMQEGVAHYAEHFAHIHVADFARFKWWSVINFYTVMGALILINLVGLSTVIFAGRAVWALMTCALGAFLLGSIAPYLLHLWRIRK
jgi:uncharacterized protein YneF (UPF0154 family)